MRRILFRREAPSLELSLKGTFATEVTKINKYPTDKRKDVHLPWRKLTGSSHVVHDLLQRLLFLNVHLEADFPLARPIVHHDEGDAPLRGGASVGRNR